MTKFYSFYFTSHCFTIFYFTLIYFLLDAKKLNWATTSLACHTMKHFNQDENKNRMQDHDENSTFTLLDQFLNTVTVANNDTLRYGNVF